DHAANLRPAKLYPGVPSPLADPGEIDFVVVREGTEGPYVGNGGALRTGTAQEIATEVSVNTAHGVERVVRHA
ncbi:isocitrate/isopropylmalate family dehydrogenase, partial [Stenotrophomonas maltophilia]